MGEHTMKHGQIIAVIGSLIITTACTGTMISGPAPKSTGVAAPSEGQPLASGRITFSGPKRRIAVVKFEDRSAFGRGRLGASASDILTTELNRTGGFILVSRADNKELLDEQAFGQSGAVNQATAAATGKILGLNAIVTGSISQFGVKTIGSEFLVGKQKIQQATATVDVRVVDAETGQVLYADSGTGVYETKTTEVLGIGSSAGYDETISGNALRAAIAQFIDNLLQQMTKIPWSGRVAALQDDLVVINAGQKTGLKIGDRLTAFALGKEVINPETGVSMGRVRGKEKGTLEITEFFGEDGSLSRVVDGSGFAAGDVVRLGQ
jgi:curli biogenesis system outer membrane secretion channel CsgG